jgi:hypothetical protein
MDERRVTGASCVACVPKSSSNVTWALAEGVVEKLYQRNRYHSKFPVLTGRRTGKEEPSHTGTLLIAVGIVRPTLSLKNLGSALQNVERRHALHLLWKSHLYSKSVADKEGLILLQTHI